MTSTMTGADLRWAVQRICNRLEGAREELNRLDAALGDGDCGATVACLAAAVRSHAETMPDDIGESLMKIAKVMARTSGSSLSGVLIAGLASTGARLNGRTEVTVRELPDVLRTSMHGMSECGGAKLGDKTILDGLAAMADALDRGQPEEIRLAAYLDGTMAAALERFRNRASRIGRARVAGERSIGQDDPGMVALKRAVEALL